MRQWSNTKRFSRVIGIALVVAAAVAPAAQADRAHSDFADKVSAKMTNRYPVPADHGAGALDPWAIRILEYGPANGTNVSPDSRAVDFRTPTPAPPTISTTGDGDFQWGDAGVGAGAMFALVALFASAGTLVRRSQGRLASR